MKQRPRYANLDSDKPIIVQKAWIKQGYSDTRMYIAAVAAFLLGMMLTRMYDLLTLRVF